MGDKSVFEIVKNRNQYECIECQYKTGNKTDYSKHLMTAKHKSRNIPQNPVKSRIQYICDCCQYKSGNKTDYEIHNLTAKHLKKSKENDLNLYKQILNRISTNGGVLS